MTPNPKPDSDFPWWLVLVAALGLWLFYEVLANAEYAAVLDTLSKGIAITVMVSVVAYAGACALGLALAVGCLSRHLVLRQVCRFYIEVMRGVPIIVLLLYVAFVLAPLLVAGVPINLPDSRAKALDQADKPVQISIDPAGKLFLDDAEISRAELPQRLADIAAKGGAESPQVYLRADRQLDYGEVMAVMGEINRAGLNRVALVTTESTEK